MTVKNEVTTELIKKDYYESITKDTKSISVDSTDSRIRKYFKAGKRAGIDRVIFKYSYTSPVIECFIHDISVNDGKINFNVTVLSIEKAKKKEKVEYDYMVLKETNFDTFIEKLNELTINDDWVNFGGASIYDNGVIEIYKIMLKKKKKYRTNT